jgi:hypothetical protein
MSTQPNPNHALLNYGLEQAKASNGNGQHAAASEIDLREFADDPSEDQQNGSAITKAKPVLERMSDSALTPSGEQDQPSIGGAPAAPEPGDTCLIRPVEDAVNSFYPGLLPAVKCALAVVCSMAFKNRTKPLAVMFESPSGFGKSAVVQMLFPITNTDGTSVTGRYTYRCDKFSPKSFVSHAANVSSAGLKEVDLLPKLKNKTLVTKEMAPIFRGREQEMEENFSTIIAVLDGKGLMTNSGTKGRRGYDGSIIFNWLGATTPLPPKTHRMMSQLGTRLLFYEIPGELPTEEALLAYTEQDEAAHAEVACQGAVNKFIVNFFRVHPVGSVAPESILIPRDRAVELARLALFVAHGRREIHYEREGGQWTPVSAARAEGPHKVVNYFKELAKAHALIEGRTEVTAEDMELVTTVAISSIPHHLRPIVRRLRRADSITSAECQRLCSVSRPTARKYLTELALTGIGALEDEIEEVPITLTLTLSPAFSWLKLP